MKHLIVDRTVRKPGGASNHGAVAGGLLFTAGMGPHQPSDELAGRTVAEKTTQVLRNLESVLAARDRTLAEVVRVPAHSTSSPRWPTPSRSRLRRAQRKRRNWPSWTASTTSTSRRLSPSNLCGWSPTWDRDCRRTSPVWATCCSRTSSRPRDGGEWPTWRPGDSPPAQSLPSRRSSEAPKSFARVGTARTRGSTPLGSTAWRGRAGLSRRR